jgi:hypothetical protein
MGDTPRSNAKMLQDVDISYTTTLWAHDNGLWTVYEIVKRPVAKVASEHAAKDLIRKITIANNLKGGAE